MDKPQSADERYMVPAVEQSFRVLFLMSQAPSSHMSLTEICAQASIHKSKAFSILRTLQKFGVVQRNVDGKGYSLGPGLIALSRKVIDNTDAARLAAPMLKELSGKASGTATLGLIAENSVFVVAKQEVDRDIGVTIRVGHRFPLTLGSHGKAIAAFLPKGEADELLNHKKLYFHGKPEKLDRVRLEKELTQCRRDGFAVDLGEIKPGLITVAAPVLGIGEIPIGYIAVIGLFSPDVPRQLGPSVALAAQTLSKQLGARTDPKSMALAPNHSAG
ncbi:MAG TPA: IclR family transcriptional regulator [Syntrophorhabdaceae bacterium]|nr:IclR family transcriptional regulator [Syntrophorhabdaceae bacterium]